MAETGNGVAVQGVEAGRVDVARLTCSIREHHDAPWCRVLRCLVEVSSKPSGRAISL